MQRFPKGDDFQGAKNTGSAAPLCRQQVWPVGWILTRRRGTAGGNRRRTVSRGLAVSQQAKCSANPASRVKTEGGDWQGRRRMDDHTGAHVLISCTGCGLRFCGCRAARPVSGFPDLPGFKLRLEAGLAWRAGAAAERRTHHRAGVRLCRTKGPQAEPASVRSLRCRIGRFRAASNRAGDHELALVRVLRSHRIASPRAPWSSAGANRCRGSRPASRCLPP